MIDTNEVHSLSEFAQNSKEHVDRLRASGRPEVLTVDGQAALVVQDADAYQRLLDENERLSAAAGIRRGLDAMKRGDMRPLDEAMDDLRRKYEQPA